MRVLTLVGLLLFVTTIPIAHASPESTPAAPPNSTDHGVNASTFPALWAGDTDTIENTTNTSALRTLASGTDLPFDSPPPAAAKWNRGDHAEFPETNQSTSIHPPDATLQDSILLKDAYVELFAIQPATTARLSPDEQPLYVAPNGSVRATVDYRVDAPAPNTTVDSRIEEVRLLVDGEVEATTDGSHTPTLPYTDLASSRDPTRVTIEADIVAEPPVDAPVAVDRVTVSDTVTVSVYDLSVSGFRGQYPNGDTGLVLYKSHPWLGYTVPGGDVRGVWRFYTARDTDWDRLQYTTAGGTENRTSPLVPLRVYAYPIETGPTPTPRGEVTILQAFGDQREPPTLPPNVSLDVLTEPYRASYGLATRIDARTTGGRVARSEIRALGLVRGGSTTPTADSITPVPINRSNLTLTIVERSATNTTVRARLTATDSGRAINTSDREGMLVIAGQRVNTTANGTVTTTLSRQDGTLAARYEPGRWWREDRGYTAASDAVYVGGTVIHFLRLLYQFAVPVSLFCGAVFIIDRLTGWHVWPPWRRL